MIELYRWLGDLNGINTLSLFEINPHDYFQKNSNREQETTRLEQELKTKYRKLQLKLHPDQLQQFPDSFKELSAEYFKEVKGIYDPLTNKEKYKNPNPEDGKLGIPGYVTATLETFTLTSYVLSLQVNQPNEYPQIDLIKKIIQARDDLETKLTAQKTNGPAITLPPKHPLSTTEYMQIIEEQESILNQKEEEIKKIKANLEQQRTISNGYRSHLKQAIDDRQIINGSLDALNKELDQLLEK